MIASNLQGIIHRDIKPENILLMADKSIKVADFGLSIDATSERPVTRAGTLDYMAPEVIIFFPFVCNKLSQLLCTPCMAAPLCASRHINDANKVCWYILDYLA